MDVNYAGRVRFGRYELDSQAEKLFRDGRLVKIQPQPLRVLVALVERPGEIVSREDLRIRIWGQATFVEFDQGLNYCIHQIRLALRDEASQPAYIETLPKQGYRFIARVDGRASDGAAEDSSNGSLKSVVAPVNGAQVASEEPPHRKPVKPLIAIGACLALAVGTGVWWMMTDRVSSIAHPLQVTRVSKLTSYPGDEREPAISPDGSYVAFSWSGASGDNYDIYVVQPGEQSPLRLTSDPAPDSFPAWSPDGRQIAFVRRKGPRSEIIVVPPLGGTERTLHQFYKLGADLDFSQHPVLSWSPDGKSIVFSGQADAGEKFRLFLLSVETGDFRPISSPDKDFTGDSSPALSADGKALAFVRYLAPLNGRLLIQPLGPGRVPKEELIDVTRSGLALRSPVWLEDGKQLLFADATRIFQWKQNKEAVPIYVADGTLGGMSLSPRRRGDTYQVVVASEKRDLDIWAIPMNVGGTKSTGPPQVLQRSTATDVLPDFSPDGRHIAFSSDRSGASEIWVSNADGSNPRQLTHLGAHVAGYARWSPDGTRIAFHARLPDVSEVYVVDVNQGVPRQITHENPGLALATWSNDGRFIYASTLVGNDVTYRIPADGGSVERLWDGSLVLGSADGRYVLYAKTNAPGIFRRSLEGDPSKSPEELLVPDFWRINQIGGYAPVAGGVYYVSADAQGVPGPFRYFDYASRKSIDVAPVVPGLSRGFTISPDRRHIAFSASAEIGGDLLSLELR